MTLGQGARNGDLRLIWVFFPFFFLGIKGYMICFVLRRLVLLAYALSASYMNA